jgi:Chaperone of endosialidase
VSNTTGNDNTASGVGALNFNTSGNYNTAGGASASHFNTTGSDNTASGFEALELTTTGSDNTALGYNALINNTSGSVNVAIGSVAGQNLTTGDYNIDILNQGVAGDHNTIRIGDAHQGKTFIAGIRGTTTGVANAVAVIVDSNGQLGTLNSSRQVKDNITDMDAASAALMRLRPVTFYYKSDDGPGARTLQYGLIAEEVAQVAPELVAHKPGGEVETVYYQFLPPMLLNEYQKQQRTIETQAQHVAELERDRLDQMARIRALEMQAFDVFELKQKVAQLTQIQLDLAQLVADRARVAAK